LYPEEDFLGTCEPPWMHSLLPAQWDRQDLGHEKVEKKKKYRENSLFLSFRNSPSPCSSQNQRASLGALSAPAAYYRVSDYLKIYQAGIPGKD